MSGRFHRGPAALSLAVLLTGCVQMTRHSNMVVFGTNTSFGIRAGASAANIPELQIGYSRQEAVVMPLIANVDSEELPSGDSVLVPCDPTKPVEVTGAAYAVHPCSLVAINGKALDSYSVLASFGAKFSGEAGTTQPKANGGLAQYFATGMAAQILALNGGAAVVAVGEAAKESSDNPVSKDSVAALFGDSNQFQVGVKKGNSYASWEDRLVNLLEAQPDDAAVVAKIKALEDAAKLPKPVLQGKCSTRKECVSKVRDDDYAQKYNMNEGDMEAALKAVGGQ